MINWSKYFDKIYCLHFIQYSNRKELMQFQLNRVGILNSGIFEWKYTFKNELNQKLEQTFIKKRHKENEMTLNVSILFGHYNCIRDALRNNYKRILILEDDIRFLKDLNKIQQILQNRPQDANLILYDKFIVEKEFLKQFNPINDYFSTFGHCCSAGCYELDRIGMQKIKNLVLTVSMTFDGYFYKSQQFLNDIKCYCSNKNLAVQALFRNSQTMALYNQTNAFMFQRFYQYLNIDFNDYMMRKDGSQYNYGDWIEINE